MEIKDKEVILEILAKELSREHSKQQIKYLKHIGTRYIIEQNQYKALTGHYYKPNDYYYYYTP